MTEPATATVDFEYRPRKSVRVAWILAVVVFLIHIVVGALLRVGGNTGVNFRVADQVALAGVGLALACGILLLTRPRLKIGAEGVTVRNLITENTYPWEDVLGFTFPEGAPWAHLELPDYEFVSVMAVQSNDKLFAVAAMKNARELTAKYKAY